MTAAYVHRSARSRKNEAIILQSLARVGQVHVAEAMGVHESKVSRFKNGELAELAGFLAAIGLKVVPEVYKCYDPKQISAVLALAKAHLSAIDEPQGLAWDGEPE